MIILAARKVRSPPPCGVETSEARSEELGVGVPRTPTFRGTPPTLTSRASFARLGPRKGGGNGMSVPGKWKNTFGAALRYALNLIEPPYSSLGLRSRLP